MDKGDDEPMHEEQPQPIAVPVAVGVTTHFIVGHPFVYITDVLRDSPAAAAGLKLGDAVVKFGELTKENTEDPVQEIA